MQKLFDKILVKRIKQVYSAHEETYNPKDWEKLASRLKKQKKGLVFFIYIAKAASVALFVVVSTFSLNNNSLKKSKLPENKISQTHINNTINKKTTTNYTANIISTNTKIQKIKNVKKETHTEKVSVLIDNESKPFIEDTTYCENKETKNNEELLAEKMPKNDFQFIKKEKHKNFNFSVAITSIYSFEKGLNTGNISMGAEFLGLYNFNQKISISSGILIAKQSIDYIENQYYTTVILTNELAADNRQLNTQLNYLGLDIPLNIAVRLNKWFFSSGISSLILLNETKTYNINTYVTGNTTKSISFEEKRNTAGSFVFANALNLSAGYEFSLHKGSLMCEAFTKQPLKNISFVDIKITTIGISLHYKF